MWKVGKLLEVLGKLWEEVEGCWKLWVEVGRVGEALGKSGK
jgi:hypothetical protein